MSELLSHALHAARLGWPVFPLIPGGKTPVIGAAHPAGHPCRGECGRPGHGFHDATTDPGTITAWWTRWPRANYGISAGPAGLVVVDLDIGKGRPADGRVLPDQGQDEPTPPGIRSGAEVMTWAAFRDHGGMRWVNTFTVATPSGGQHLYYAAPAASEGQPVRGSVGVTAGRITGLGWSIDVRAQGGYVAGPGSAGPAPRVASARSGQLPLAGPGYRVIESRTVALLPGWLAARIARIGSGSTPPCMTGGRAGRGRHQAAGRVRPGYADAAIAGELAAIAAATPGDTGGAGRNATVNRAAYKLGRLADAFALDVGDLAADLLAAALATGLSEREASAAIASGLAQGRANPRTLRTAAAALREVNR